MLRAITVDADGVLVLSIDSEEYVASVPDFLLDESELAQVRAVLSDALPGYVCKQPPEAVEEVAE